MLAAVISVWYGKSSAKCPVRGFGEEVQNRMLFMGDLWYSVNHTRRNGENGVLISVREAQTSSPFRNVWIPFSELSKVRMEFKGVEE